jgi:hypothetical protein
MRLCRVQGDAFKTAHAVCSVQLGWSIEWYVTFSLIAARNASYFA